jgi:type IV secretory pathway protease TraF
MATTYKLLTWTFAFLLVYACTYPFLFYNKSRSMPGGWYWCAFEDSNVILTPGTIVLFTPTQAMRTDFLERVGPRYEDARLLWLKKVIRQEGDNLYIEGTHPLSYDSHLFGPIPRVSVKRTCTPLWTWE